VDATWALIRGLKALGLATDLQLLPQGADRFRIDRREAMPVGASAVRLELEAATADPAL
jgi:hypothetical protein